MEKSNLYTSSLKLTFFISVLFLYMSVSYSQPSLPSRSLTVNATQALSFGTFALSGGGEGVLTVGTDGYRTAIQNVYLSELTPNAQPAVFEIKLCQGRNVRITYDTATVLTRIGGGAMRLELGPAKREGIVNELENGDSFPSQNNCNFITILRVGGTLRIPSNSLGGIYTGDFNITFDQE
jgi:hypothetical protein